MANPFPFTSGQILTAAQMNSIGEAGIAYTPTVTAGSGTFTTVSATASYVRVNKLVLIKFSVNITNNGTAGGSVLLTLPFSCTGVSGGSIGSGREFAATGQMFNTIFNTSANIFLISPTNGYPGGTGYNLGGFAILEAV